MELTKFTFKHDVIRMTSESYSQNARTVWPACYRTVRPSVCLSVICDSSVLLLSDAKYANVHRVTLKTLKNALLSAITASGRAVRGNILRRDIPVSQRCRQV